MVIKCDSPRRFVKKDLNLATAAVREVERLKKKKFFLKKAKSFASGPEPWIKENDRYRYESEFAVSINADLDTCIRLTMLFTVFI